MEYIYLLKKQGEFYLDSLFKYRFVRIVLSALLMGAFLVCGDFAYTQLWNDWIHLKGFIPFILLTALICAGVLIYFLTLLFSGGILWSEVKQFVKPSRKKV